MAANMVQFSALALLSAVTAVIFRLFNIIQPQPYMDEIFHIPQAQNYCMGNFSHWNNKITTLPGLYIVSLIQLRLQAYLPFLGSFFNSEEPCSAAFLRFGNILFMMLNFWLLYELSFAINLNKLRKDAILEREGNVDISERKKNKIKEAEICRQSTENEMAAEVKLSNQSFANAFVLSFFPLLYFFAFLYYTDQGSTAMVLLTYWFSLQESHINAALTGVVAVCFRQTNIVWVAFVGGASLLKEMEHDLPDIRNGVRYFFDQLFFAIQQKASTVIEKAVPYGLVGIAFCVFIIKNNGIVVGDRSSHQACLNIPQILYFVGFTMAFGFLRFFSKSSLLLVISKIKDITQSKAKSILALISILLIGIVIAKFTYVHEYILADNRHYTFYVWRKIFQRHWLMKYACIPCYLYGCYLMYQHLSAQNSKYFIILLTACIALVTIPQKLLEFRYFIIPYLFFRLHIQLPSYLSLALELVLYACLNGITMLLFLYKPFYWDNDVSIQRFMW